MSNIYILRAFGIFHVQLVYSMAIWYILRPYGIFYGHMVYFTAIWYILRPFGIFYGHYIGIFEVIWYIYFIILVCRTRKNSGNSGQRWNVTGPLDVKNDLCRGFRTNLLCTKCTTMEAGLPDGLFSNKKIQI
jgi:hypothetical protein